MTKQGQPLTDPQWANWPAFQVALFDLKRKRKHAECPRHFDLIHDGNVPATIRLGQPVVLPPD